MASTDGLDRLRAALGHLKPAERRVAETLLTGGPAVLGVPVAALAGMSQVSPATVVRLAQTLGYRSYRELRLSLVRAEGAGGGTTLFEAIGDSDTPEAVAEKVAVAATATIQASRRLLDMAVVARVVGALAGAPRVETYGVGASGIVATDAAAKLRRVGLPAWSHADPHQQAQSASLLTPGCVAIAFSHSGATRDVLHAAAIAREAGAVVAAVTSFPLSPLARAVDHVLLTAGADEPTERSGSTSARLAQIYVTDVLTICYSLAHREDAQTALARSGAAVDPLRRAPSSRRRRP